MNQIVQKMSTDSLIDVWMKNLFYMIKSNRNLSVELRAEEDTELDLSLEQKTNRQFKKSF